MPDFPSLSAIESDLTQLFQVNVVGVAFVVNTFLPLIRKGGWKKVVTISTGFADEIFVSLPIIPANDRRFPRWLAFVDAITDSSIFAH